MPRSAVLAAALLLLPILPAFSQERPAERVLHLGAHVRAKVPKVAPGWIEGTIVGAQRSPNCFAIRLEHTDAEGRQQYAFLSGVTEMEVDRRTNDGILTVGLPPATAEDWEPWSKADLRAAVARCGR